MFFIINVQLDLKAIELCLLKIINFCKSKYIHSPYFNCVIEIISLAKNCYLLLFKQQRKYSPYIIFDNLATLILKFLHGKTAVCSSFPVKMLTA